MADKTPNKKRKTLMTDFFATPTKETAKASIRCDSEIDASPAESPLSSQELSLSSLTDDLGDKLSAPR